MEIEGIKFSAPNLGERDLRRKMALFRETDRYYAYLENARDSHKTLSVILLNPKYPLK